MGIDELIRPPDYSIIMESVFSSIHTVDEAQLSERLRPLSYPEFLATAYWKAVAHAVKNRDKWRCKVCNRNNNLDAHHRVYCVRGTEHLHLDDLTTLCRSCHEMFPQLQTK